MNQRAKARIPTRTATTAAGACAATGEVELEGKVLRLRWIHVKLELRAAPENHASAERVHRFFADS